MREIKFRGKSIETGECIYGNLIGTDVIVGAIVEWDDEYFCTEFWYKVDPETVGQFTGLKDRNGKDIYEGDIMRGYNAFGESFAQLTVVKWDEKEACWLGCDWSDLKGEEVIGNIYSNPELLEATT